MIPFLYSKKYGFRQAVFSHKIKFLLLSKANFVCRMLSHKFLQPLKMAHFERFLLKTAQNRGVFSIRCPFKSNKRSHSGDDGDEDPPVPIPREQSAALPSPSKGNGRRQKLSSSTAKVVGTERLGESSWHRAPARIANCRISIKNDRFSTEKRSFFLRFQGLSSCPFCAVLLGFLLSFWSIFK